MDGMDSGEQNPAPVIVFADTQWPVQVYCLADTAFAEADLGAEKVFFYSYK